MNTWRTHLFVPTLPPLPKWQAERANANHSTVQASNPVMLPDDPLLTTEQAGFYLSLSPSTLTVWRCHYPDRIPYLKLGKAVRYRRSALDRYLERCRVQDGGGVKS